MRLTKLEKDALARAAEFVLAGEWPWTHDPDSGGRLSPERLEREQNRLERARDKLRASPQKDRGGDHS